MSDVQFEEDEFITNPVVQNTSEGTSGIVKVILKTNIVKNARQANYVLAGITAVCIFTTLLVLVSTFSYKVPKTMKVNNVPQEVKQVLPPDVLRNLNENK